MLITTTKEFEFFKDGWVVVVIFFEYDRNCWLLLVKGIYAQCDIDWFTYISSLLEIFSCTVNAVKLLGIYFSFLPK